ncbi:EAL domain-containing protein [Geminocystis sp. GBBB08]|uniref:bifunctional diguanylate cyclase/phosphodiesterase n=1 Tax=Geminocystis sp. GBBB08 TaxID=2604140 RepID=UPI0027E25F09|nr:EAL domain-containing protein [Geminocystis sp. GBBB08]MBL1210494.1 EAL domain-containing protein [Geminocystis sp. GBBB08]
MESIFMKNLSSNHDSLRQFYEYICLSGNLDCHNFDLNSIDTPIALIKPNTHHLIDTNQCFRESFHIYDPTLIQQSTLEDYIQPYTIEQIFTLVRENSYLLIPKICHHHSLNSYSSPLNNYFQLYNLSLNLVTWQSEKVIIAIFYQLLHNSIVDLSLQLSKFSSLVNNLPAVIYQCRNDEHWTVEYISENCWDLTGYDADQFINNRAISYNTLIYNSDRHSVWQEVQSALASRTIFEIEYRIVHYSGEIKWVWEQGKGIYSLNGELLYLQGLIVDITEKRKKEQEKSLLLNISQAITSAVDFDTALLYTIQKVCQLTDWDFGEAWLPDTQEQFFSFSTAWFSPQKNYREGDDLSLQDFKQESYNYNFEITIGLPGKIWSKKKTIWLNDVSEVKWFLRRELASKCGLKAAFGVPIMAGEEVVAVLIFFSRRNLPTDNDLLTLIEAVAYQLGTIFKHKQIEFKLHQSQRELSTIIDSTSGVFFRISYDDNWGKDYISKGCLGLTGYSSSELFSSGKINLVKITHPLDLEKVLSTIKTSINKKINYSIEYRIFTKHNQEKWLWEKGKGIFDREGKLLGIEGLITDISERKEMEYALCQAENKYRNFFENAIEGIFQTTADGCYLTANKALAKIYGYDSALQLIENLNDIENSLYLHSEKRKEFILLLEKNDAITNFESQVYRRDGSIIWISENARAVRNIYGDLLYYEGTVKDITKYKEAQEKLHHQAFYDNLTQLPNRTYFLQQLSNSIYQLREFSSSNYQFSVLFLDCDRFKAVNDSLGHGVGDLLLIAIGERLQSCVGDNNLVARLGGDEFTILCDEVTDVKQVIKLAENINTAFQPPFIINQYQLFCRISIGIFFSSSIDVEQYNFLTPAQILQYADTALYKAKSQKRGYYQVIQGEMHNEALAQLQLENEIRQGLVENEFLLYYQPIIKINTGEIKGFESLIRWNHPQKGLTTPNYFLNIAEETGLIIPMGFAVLKQACHQWKKWHEKIIQDSLNLEELPVLSVNLSCQEFNAENFLIQLDNIIEETRVNPEYIKLEITESCSIFQEDFSLDILQQIIQRKIQLWVDDFGTGYSSLSYLHKLPINGLKLDRFFIANIDEDVKKAKIVKAILSLAEDLDLEVIVEGIETEKQLQILEEIGCKLAQGYLFSRPLSAQNAYNFIHNLRYH